MLNLTTVKQDILAWSENFVEVPHPALGGWAPCPFARKARLTGTVNILVGVNPYFDLKNCCRQGMGKYEVIIYAYDPEEFPYARFHQALEDANQEFLVAKDLLVLEDHPAEAELVNGVCMNQGKYALSLVQSLSKLDDSAEQMANKGFYHTWPEEYLTALFNNRKDPR
tara:strand:+ start:878 stop:1381 length:504 start_codon:yes stop_codon:yes gene_type:complete